MATAATIQSTPPPLRLVMKSYDKLSQNLVTVVDFDDFGMQNRKRLSLWEQIWP
jgi:hypothetical protein